MTFASSPEKREKLQASVAKLSESVIRGLSEEKLDSLIDSSVFKQLQREVLTSCMVADAVWDRVFGDTVTAEHAAAKAALAEAVFATTPMGQEYGDPGAKVRSEALFDSNPALREAMQSQRGGARAQGVSAPGQLTFPKGTQGGKGCLTLLVVVGSILMVASHRNQGRG